MEKIIIDSAKKHQTFEGIGCSGAWWAQLVGGWNQIDEESGLPVCERIAQLLYSKDEGIGLNAYRYNIGTGSSESGKGNIDMKLRRTHGIETESGEIDLSLDANAVRMTELAVKYGAQEVILFVNSPPERMTANGLAHCDKSFPPKENLPKENYGEFVKFCLDVTEKFVEKGVPVKYLSPVNEPLWVWTGGQEGCHYRPSSVRKLMKVFAEEMPKRKKLAGVKLSGAENGDVRWYNKSYTRAMLGDSKISKLTDGIDVHSYFLSPVSVPFFSKRVPYIRRFGKWVRRKYPDKNIRMSEWCHMQGGRDAGMGSGLVTAQVIIEDLTILGASAWQHWIGVSEVDYCDGLIYIDENEGTFYTTKRYYVTGNFSKYIPLGAKRIDCKATDSRLLTAAFEKDGKTVIVVSNPTDEEITLSVPFESGTIAVTDETRNLEESRFENKEIAITPKSVNTVIG